MSSSPDSHPKDLAPAPQARESDWYNEHYEHSGTAPSDKLLVGSDLLKHLGPWYGFALPHLRTRLKKDYRFLELGCGTCRLPTQLVREGLLAEANVYGLDQSSVAVAQGKKALPTANIKVGDIYDLKLPLQFDVITLMEVIEHLEFPEKALEQIRASLKPGGLLYVSFPNFVHLPWLAVRILSEKLNRPNWIVLQPIDKIYTVWSLRRLVERFGFKLETAIGSNYGPPIFYPLERPWMTRALNRLGLWWISFHPILVFRKNDPE